MPRSPAEVLIRCKKVKVGWTSCPVREKLKVLRCYKCLELGHAARTCTSSEDRSNICFKCAQPGHQAKDCSSEIRCTKCNVPGHSSDQLQCPVFRQELTRNRLPEKVATNLAQNRRKVGQEGLVQVRQIASKMVGNLKILQMNVGRSRAATDLAMATANLLVVVEPNIRKVQGKSWARDLDCWVAINVINGDLRQPKCHRGNGYLVLEFEEITLVGCYISPNITVAEYDIKVYVIMDTVLRNLKRTMIMGDLNAKSSTWSSPVTDRRGHVWEAIFLAAGVTPLN